MVTMPPDKHNIGSLHWMDGSSCSLLNETVGADMAQNVAFLPSIGASGGILIAASDRFFTIQNTYATTNTISATVTMLAENVQWSITGVYGPQTDNEKILFMQEITDLKQQMLPEWLLLGDFNLIYRAQDKNNGRLNIPMLNRFKNTIDNLFVEGIGKGYPQRCAL